MKKLISFTLILLFSISSAYAQCGLKARTQQNTSNRSSVSIPEGTNEKQFKTLAIVNKKEARKIAVSKYDGKVKDARLINKEGTLVWQLDVKGNEGIKEIFIDPANGEFIGFGLTK